MTLDQIKQLEYQGGGYFRMRGPKGKKMPTIHAPHLLKIMLKLLAEAQQS